MDYVIINASGEVLSRVSADEGYEPGPDLIALPVAADEVAYAGCTWSEEGGIVEPAATPVDPAAHKTALRVYAADKRWRVETGGITVGGIAVATDDRSKLMITGARVKADTDPAFTTKWKTPGGFVTIDAAALIAISDAVLSHVDACFAAEADVLQSIAAGVILTTEQIDAASWPTS